MRTIEGLQAWGRILMGRFPTLSIEITKECPLRCPGCYAYEDSHLGGDVKLRELADLKGQALVEGVLALARHYQPLHLSIVGGDPLVRFREVDILLPQLNQMGIFVQLVTSAFRPIPVDWAKLSKLNLVVSIDGLQPEHDRRRTPATYDRILKNISGQCVIIHCTVTGQMMKTKGYLEAFLNFWCPRPEIKKVWVSFFTPQKGDHSPECLTTEERDQAVLDLGSLRYRFPKLDMAESTLREFMAPPQSPKECLFSLTTLNISADLKTTVSPCQLGGDPDCSRCGCLASMALAAVGHHRLPGGISLGGLYRASAQVGNLVSKLQGH
jgi:MoaA/NifB/PqqE/SkfB family radical SAM enzyme